MVYAFLLLSIAFCCLFSEGWANEIYVVSSFEGTVMDTVEPLQLHASRYLDWTNLICFSIVTYMTFKHISYFSSFRHNSNIRITSLLFFNTVLITQQQIIPIAQRTFNILK